jgi:hypothetical protein
MSRLLSIAVAATAGVLVVSTAGCKGGGGSGKARAEYRDVVAKCVRLMAVDFDAARDEHAALAGWQSPAPGARRIDHATKAGGILVMISRPAEKKAEHEFPHLGLAAFVEVSGEKKFVRTAREIVAGRLVPLRDLDVAVGKSMKGLVADLAVAGSRHPELSGIKSGAPTGSRLDYSRGNFRLTVWADLAPQKARDVQCFPLCARIEGGSSALRKEVLALVRKNLEALRELERRTGGWKAK